VTIHACVSFIEVTE